MAYVCILAKKTAEITARCGDRIGKRAGKKMEKGFFFNGIAMTGDDLTVDEAVKRPGPVFTHSTDSLLSFSDETSVIAEKTANPVGGHFFIQIGFFHFLEFL